MHLQLLHVKNWDTRKFRSNIKTINFRSIGKKDLF